jgi:ABC-type nitrate/sulfonate/bicarbonate transport system ATPase subunit
VVFQSPCLLPWLSAYDNVRLGVEQVFWSADKSERHAIVEYYLTVVGLGDAMHKFPHELSQGMRQRVGIARAFALSPKMLLLDEPFGMLDTLTRYELQGVLLDLWRRNQITALMVTHDVDEAIFLADRVVMMTNGPAAEVGDVLEIPFPRPRDRKAIMEDPEYYRLREHLIDFLEHRSHLRPSLAGAQTATPPSEGPPSALTPVTAGA